jgi:hypothetical protein
MKPGNIDKNTYFHLKLSLSFSKIFAKLHSILILLKNPPIIDTKYSPKKKTPPRFPTNSSTLTVDLVYCVTVFDLVKTKEVFD